MNPARRIAHRRWWRLAGLVALAVIVVPPAIVEVSLAPAPAVAVPAVPGPGPYHVYVADWGFHTSIIVEQAAGLALGPEGAEQAPYVEWAWGEKRFYMESNYAPWSVFGTVFLPNRTVTYVAGWRAPPVAGPSGARWVYRATVSGEAYAALLGEFERSIRHGAGGARVAPYPAVAGYAGRFYPAFGSYLGWNDCNRWTVDRLHGAGLARSGVGVITPGQVPGRLIGFERVGEGGAGH